MGHPPPPPGAPRAEVVSPARVIHHLTASNRAGPSDATRRAEVPFPRTIAIPVPAPTRPRYATSHSQTRARPCTHAPTSSISRSPCSTDDESLSKGSSLLPGNLSRERGVNPGKGWSNEISLIDAPVVPRLGRGRARQVSV